MNNAYITKRVAPPGYVAITRSLAEVLFNAGHAVTLCGSKVNNFGVFDNEHYGFTVTKDTADRPFALLIYDYRERLPKSLGRECVYYARREDAETVLETITSKEVLVRQHNARRTYASRH
jgi:hypothetical protein